MTHVYVTTYLHKHGQNVYVNKTMDGAQKLVVALANVELIEFTDSAKTYTRDDVESLLTGEWCELTDSDESVAIECVELEG